MASLIDFLFKGCYGDEVRSNNDLLRWGPISSVIFSRLSLDDVVMIVRQFPREDSWVLDLPCEREMRLIGFAASNFPGLADKMLVPAIVPPDRIHRMQRGRDWVGDIYSSNMIFQALNLAGCVPSADSRFLDFGCSSGSLLRMVKAAFPAMRCFGCDPVLSSIEWASKNLPAIDFFSMDLVPPLSLVGGCVDIVSAVSIWSHYSPSAAREWLSEMRRILAPSGYLVMTIHGLYSLRWLSQAGQDASRISEIYNHLVSDGFFFESLDIESELNLSSDWGMFYMSSDYLRQMVGDCWDVCLHLPGRNQWNQDVVVLRARE